MHFKCRIPKTLWVILAVALALRLLGAWRANLIFDERAHLALAETIDFRPGHLHLVSRTLDHPLLSIYILRLGGLLCGDSDLGLRILYVLAGTATVVPVYCLGRRVFSENAGLWAAAVIAVDQFHASWSRVFMPEVWMLLFASLALLQFLRTLENDSTKNYVLLGVLLGLTCLAKEPGVLLVGVLWAYLSITPRFRRILIRPRWYLAQGVFLLVIAPDIAWNLSQWTESYLYRGAAFLSEPWALSMKSFSLYLGELLRILIDANLLDIGYEDGGVYACHPLAGILYLAAVLVATAKGNVPEVRLMLVAFFLVFGVFLVMPGGERFDPFWWASLSLIPAVVCAGGMLDLGLTKVTQPRRRSHSEKQSRFLSRRVLAWLVGILLLGYLGIHYLPLAWRTGPHQPRVTVDDLVADFLREGDIALEAGRLHEAKRRYIYVLNVGGPNRNAYLGLAVIAERQGHAGRAELLRGKCRRPEPE